MKYLYIRVDMNNIIATGHVMRCLSIADAAKLIGIESIFLLADSNAIELLQSKGYSYIVLNTQWNKLDLECDIICDIVQQKRIDILLIDTYQVTDNYLRKLSEITKTIYIDDINKMIYPVHGIICYANYWKKFIYEEQYREALNRNMIKRMPEFYLGCSYAPLRQEFSNTSRKCIKDNPESLLIMSGGTDPYDIIRQVLASIDRKRYREINAICGRLNSNVEELRLKYEQEENVHIFSSVLNMIDYMKQADIAISAGGTTLYELCAVGTPTITYSFADNQLDNVRSFEEDGIMNYAGDARCDSVGENVERLLRDYVKIGVRKQKSKRMQNLVDGYGANRICNSFTAKSM